MSNIFQEVLTNARAAEEKYLGPNYPYHKYIRTPSEIGMSSKGSLSALGNNIDGLIGYVELLVSGGGEASATGKPLGNKFFLKTGAKCGAIDSCTDPNNPSTCQKVDRYMYINNIPEGNIPFISSGLGVNFSEFKGLIPGAMGNLNVLNPFAIMRAFLSGSNPPCQPLTMSTLTTDNIKSSETHYVTLTDISNMDPCSFSDKKNPVSKKKCKETFDNYNRNPEIIIPDDILAQIYFASLGVVGIYILYKLMEKSH